jgi:hypothetical protein
MTIHPLNAEMPPLLNLADSTGAVVFGLAFENSFGSDPSGQVVAPFSWRPGPPGVPAASALKITPGAALTLSALTPPERWEQIRNILEAKYAEQGAFIASDGRLMITSVDLADASLTRPKAGLAIK